MNYPCVGVIGVGNFGQNHARILSELPLCEFIGIYDIDEERADFISRRHNVPAYSSAENLIKSVDHIFVVTPTTTHHEIALLAIEKGVHTFIEKPISFDINFADTVIAAAEKMNVKLSVGHLERFNPSVEAAVNYCGKVNYFRSERLGTWAGKNLDVDVITDLMIHDLDLLNMIDSSPIVEISAIGSIVLSDKTDIASVQIRRESGLVATLESSRISAEKQRRLRLYGQHRYVSADLINQKCDVVDRVYSGPEPHLERNELEIARAEPLKEEIKAFLNLPDSRAGQLCSGAEAREAVFLANRINAVLRSC